MDETGPPETPPPEPPPEPSPEPVGMDVGAPVPEAGAGLDIGAPLPDAVEPPEPVGQSIGTSLDELDRAQAERIADKFDPDHTNPNRDEIIDEGMETFKERHQEAVGRSLGKESLASPETPPEDPDQAILDLKKSDDEVADLAKNFQVPDGMGNSVERAGQDPLEVQELEAEFAGRQAALDMAEDALKEKAEGGIKDYMNQRQEPAEDYLDVADSTLKNMDIEPDAFSKEEQQQIAQLEGEIKQMESDQQELAEKIKRARESAVRKESNPDDNPDE